MFGTQPYTVLSSTSESTGYISPYEDETEAKTESIFSTSADYDDDDDYESHDDWYGTVKKTLFQNTVGLLNGFDDHSEDGSTEYDFDETSRFTEDSRTNTTQGDGVSSLGLESAHNANERSCSPELQKSNSTENLQRESKYLTFRKQGTVPLRNNSYSNPISLRRNFRPLRSPQQKRSLSPYKRPALKSPSESFRRSRLVSPPPSRVPSRSLRHLQFHENTRQDFIEGAVISGDGDSNSEESPIFPLSPLLEPLPSGFVAQGHLGHIDGRHRRTKLGDLSWDAQSFPRKRLNEKMIPCSAKLSNSGKMSALADMTTPHSMVNSDSSRTPKFDSSSNGQDLDFHKKLSCTGTESNENSQEENEIVFDVADEKNSGNLWEDESVWNVGDNDWAPRSDDDSIHQRMNGRGSNKTDTKADKLKNLLQRANCAQGNPRNVLENTSAKNPRAREDLFVETGFKKEKEAPTKGMGLLQHFNNTQCVKYPQFDENKLRAIVDVESSTRSRSGQSGETKSLDQKDDAHRSKSKPKRSPKGRINELYTNNLNSQLVAMGKRVSCSTISTVDSLKAETPKAPSKIHQKRYVDHKRRRPRLRECEPITEKKGCVPPPMIVTESQPEQIRASAINSIDRLESSQDMCQSQFLAPMYATTTGKLQWLSVKENKQQGDTSEHSSNTEQYINTQNSLNRKLKTRYGTDVDEFRGLGGYTATSPKTTDAESPRIQCSLTEEKTMPSATNKLGSVKKALKYVAQRASPRNMTRSSKRGNSVGAFLPKNDSQNEALIPSQESSAPHDSLTHSSASRKPLVSALRKSSVKTQNNNFMAHSQSNNSMQKQPRGSKRRVVFSEKVEEAFYEGIPGSPVSPIENDVWAAGDFMRAFGSCGQDYEDEGDADSTTPTADFSIKRKICNTPDDLNDFYYQKSERCDGTLTPASSSAPLLPDISIPSNQHPSPPEDTNLNHAEVENIGVDTNTDPSNDRRPRFNIFRRKKDSHASHSKSEISKGRKIRYHNLNEQGALVEEKSSSIAKTKNRSQRMTHDSTEAKSSDKTSEETCEAESSIELVDDTIAYTNKESNPKVGAPKKTKKKLKLKLFKRSHVRLHSEEDKEIRDNTNAITEKQVDEAPLKQTRQPRKKVLKPRLRVRRGAAKSTYRAASSKLSVIPEEDSTQGSISDDTCPELDDIKPLQCDTKTASRLNIFRRRRKEKKEKKPEQTVSTLYARRQRERMLRFSRKTDEQGNEETGSLSQEQSNLPPVLIVPAKRDVQKDKCSVPAKEPKSLLVNDASTENSIDGELLRLRQIEQVLARQMMEDLLLLAKLEKQQREIVKSGGKNASVSQNLLDAVVARVQNTVEETKRIRKSRARSKGGNRRAKYVCPETRASVADVFPCSAQCSRSAV